MNVVSTADGAPGLVAVAPTEQQDPPTPVLRTAASKAPVDANAVLPNLVPFQPLGWSAPVVVSNTTGTTTDSSLQAGQPLYVDWAFINNSTVNIAVYFDIQIWVDGVLRTWWTGAGLQAGYYGYVNDYSIGALSAGTHTVQVFADSGGVVSEVYENDNVYTKTIFVSGSLPNLTSYTPTGWSAPIVVSTATGTSTDTTLPAGQALYVDWAVINNGPVSVPSSFNIQLYVDNVLKTWWTPLAGLQSGWYSYDTDYAIGSLTAGTHTVKIVADSTGAISESNESDNVYTKTIQVVASTPEIRIDPLSLSFTAPAGSSLQTDAEAAEPNDYRLHLKSGVVDPRVAGRTPDTLSFARAAGGGRHHIVQFERELAPDEVAALATDSIRVLGYIPNYAYWVAVDDVARLASVTAGGGVRAVWKPGADAKTDRYATTPPASGRALDGTVPIYVRAFADVPARELDAALSARGFPAAQHRFGDVYELRVLPVEVSGLAELDEIEWVEAAPPPNIPYNATAAQRIHASDLWISPYSLSGDGVVVGVWDEGIIYGHGDFGSRLNIGETGGTVSWHGTHVGGTIAGSGAGNAQARGGARGATLWSWNWTNDSAEMRAAVGARGVRISNHSYGIIAGWFWDGGSWVNYGTGNFGNYDATAAEWDDVVRDTGLIVMKAAGNDRGDDPDGAGPLRDGPYDTISTYGNAKNIITVCATTDGDGMTSFSSWGPTNDGRVKPDICANGDGLLSTVPGGGYGTASGTSMATPSASGATALLLEQFADLSLARPKPETVKALLIQGASDLGRTGPDYEYGWGLLNVKTTADLIRNGHFRTSSLSASTDKRTYSIDVAASTPSLRVTLAWTDPPASPSAAITLVNDLDLVLTSPTGVVYRPWVLDGASPATNAARGINHRDNVEQAVVSSPAAGRWTVTVSATTLPSGPQDFTVTGPAIGEGSGGGTSKTFTIYNDGAGTLNIQGLTLAEAAPWIKTAPAAPFAIAPGDARQVTVTVDYAAAPAGTTTRRILVASNDSNENPYPGGVNVTVTKSGGGGTVGFTVTPTSGLRTTEAGGTATFTMKLNAAPTANVTIGLSTTDATEGTVSPVSFTFTPSNWATAQTATARGVNDLVIDGDVAYTIVTAAAVSTDSRYTGLNPANVSAVNVDDERPGFTVTPVSGLRTTEGGGTASFTMKLTAAPTANVTVRLSTTDTTEGTVSPSSFTFTPSNWATAQTGTARGVNDTLVDGDVAYTVVTAAAVSTDIRYNGLNPANVSVVNVDDERPGFTVTPVSGLRTTEAGGTATFTIKLNLAPTANVTIGISSTDTTEGTVSTVSLMFTPLNWATLQTVTVRGVNDTLDDGDISYKVVTSAAASADARYNGLNPANVSVVNVDND